MEQAKKEIEANIIKILEIANKFEISKEEIKDLFDYLEEEEKWRKL